MPDMFATVPPPEPPSSSTTANPTIEEPSKIVFDIDRGATTTTTALEAIATHASLISIVYLLATLIQVMA